MCIRDRDGTVEIQIFPVFGHVACGAEQHRGVAVVSAGMHVPLVSRTVWAVILLQQGQRVHIGTQTDRTRTVPPAQNADDAGSGQSSVHLQSIAGQLASDQLGGPRLVESEFRVSVDVTPNRREFGEKRDVQRCHGP